MTLCLVPSGRGTSGTDFWLGWAEGRQSGNSNQRGRLPLGWGASEPFQICKYPHGSPIRSYSYAHRSFHLRTLNISAPNLYKFFKNQSSHLGLNAGPDMSSLRKVIKPFWASVSLTIMTIKNSSELLVEESDSVPGLLGEETEIFIFSRCLEHIKGLNISSPHHCGLLLLL